MIISLAPLLLGVPALAADDDMYFDPTSRPQGHARVSEGIARPKRTGPPSWPSGADRSLGIVRCDLQVYVGRRGETRAVRIERCPEPFRETARAHAASWTHEPVRLGGGIKPVWYPVEIVFNGSAQALRPEPTPRPRDTALKVLPGEVVLHQDEAQVDNRVLPEFPPDAVSQGIVEVHCAVRVHVDAEGDVSDVGFERCPEAFHDPVLGAIALWSHGEVAIAGKATPFTYQTMLKLRHDPDTE